MFEFPSESPNDGPRTLVTNPADADASPFGWHDTNGAAGAEFTITQGNNATPTSTRTTTTRRTSAGSPDGGAGLDFDFAADLTQHAQNYRDAVVTNLFYGNNVFHDVMHGYGFNEAAGNFQANNYGRGGTGATTCAPRRPTAAARTTPTSRRPSRRRPPAARRGCRCTSGPGTSSAPRTRWSSTGSARSTRRGHASAPRRPSPGRRAVHQRRQRLRGRRLPGLRRRMDRDRHRRQRRLPERRQGPAGRGERRRSLS